MIDHLRRQRRHIPIEDVEAMLVTEGFEASANARIDVARLLGTLPPKQSRAIRDTHIDGQSIAEAATEPGSGSPTSRFPCIAAFVRSPPG